MMYGRVIVVVDKDACMVCIALFNAPYPYVH